MIKQIPKQKVYIVLGYYGDYCKVLDIYSTRKAANKAMQRLNYRLRYSSINLSYHVIEKSVKGAFICQNIPDNRYSS